MRDNEGGGALTGHRKNFELGPSSEQLRVGGELVK